MTDPRRVAPSLPFGRITPTAAEGELDFLGALRTLWRGKLLILLFLIAGLALGSYYVFGVAVPKYRAMAVVALEDREGAVVDMESVLGGLSSDQATLNTEVEVMRSRRLASRLVRDLSLLQDPEFNRALRSVEPWSLGWLKQQLAGEAPEPTQEEIFDSTVDALLDAIDIFNVRESYVFKIVAETTSPQKSARIANALAELYIQDQLELKFEATQKATTWLSEQVVELKAELQASEERLKEFHASTEVISSETLAMLSVRMKDLRDRLADTRAVTQEFEAQLEMLENGREGRSPAELAELIDDRVLAQMVERLEAGTGSLEAFDQRLEQIQLRLRGDMAREARQSEVLQGSIAELENRIDRQGTELLALQQLEREIQATALIYETFLSRMKEISIQQGLQEPDARMLSAAVVRKQAASPRLMRVLGLSGLLALLAGAAIVMLRERQQNVFRTAEDLEEFSGVPVLGQIPRGPTGKRQRLLQHIIDKPASAFSEAVRNLRTSVLLSNVDKPPKVIMLTSSVPGEGKTTQSLSLAQNLSQMGKSVLLIEADMRRRTFLEYFDVPKNAPGLAAAVGGTPLSDVVVRSEPLGMDILLGENSSVNAADFFSSKRFADFLRQAAKAYDFVLLDTPPVLAVPDARVIGRLADAIVYVVHWDSTAKEQVAAGLRSLQTLDLRISGLVLSQVDPKGMKRYGNAYGNYGTGYYDK